MTSMTVPSILPVNKAIKRHSKPQKTDIIRERLMYFLSDILLSNLLTKSSMVTADSELMVELKEDIAADMIATIKIPIIPEGR